jgi:hypothetical protein
MPEIDGAAELAFIRTASWLYSHYFEAGRIGVKFLTGRQASGESKSKQHLTLVHALRTWSQHNINPGGSDHDLNILKICSQWFETACGALIPRSESAWSKGLGALLQDACEFINELVNLIEQIRQDEARDEICRQWQDRISRDWPAHRYHQLIADAAGDIGQSDLDAQAFFSRQGHEIRKALALFSSEGDLEKEARRCIERILLTEFSQLLPITGGDIIQYFGIPPGPRVGELLMEARKIYETERYTRDQLLQRLRDAE